MQAVVDSLLTHYEVQGKGTVILLLHGWGDTAAGLAGLRQSLAASHTVIAVDLPGFGGTEAPKEVWGLSQYAQFVADFLKKIDARQLAGIVGHSNGGAIAVRGLSSGILKADKLVLLASAGIRGVYKGRVRVLRYATKIGKALTMPLPKAIKQKLRRKVYQTVGSDMLVAEHLQETFKRVVTDDIRTNAAQLTVPTLLIYGEQDEATPLVYGETFHQLIAGSTLEVLPGAGHFVHLDRPQAVERAIQEFVG